MSPRVARIDAAHYEVSDRDTGVVRASIRWTDHGWLATIPGRRMRQPLGRISRADAVAKIVG